MKFISKNRNRSGHFSLDALESRRLLAATVTTQIPSQTLSSSQSTVLTLSNYFDDNTVTAGDTVVNLQTNLPAPDNSIPLMLTNSATPNTVANFLQYITTGEYANTIIHRSVPGFVIQGGGYDTNGTLITSLGTIAGESSTATLKNTTGTIAMALSTGPNSATSEWYINLGNNSELDNSSDGGPFTAFGKVLYNGLKTADAIAALPIVDDTSNGAWNTLPVQGPSSENGQTVSSVPNADFVILNPVIVPGGLTYSLSSSNASVATGSISNGQLTISSVSSGTANLTITATDLGGGTATSTFAVTVPAAAATLSPNLTSTGPSTNIAGQDLKLKEKLTLTATGGAITGSANANILLSPDQSASDSVQTLATGQANLKLKSNQATNLTLKLPKTLPATLSAGTYHVLIELTPPNGTATTIDSGKTFTVVAPVVDLSGSFAKNPVVVKAGKKSTVTITLTNSSTANISATGKLPIALSISTDSDSADATPLPSTTQSINIKPGASKKITVPVTISAGDAQFIFAVLDPGSAVFPDDVDTANNTFDAPLSITGQ